MPGNTCPDEDAQSSCGNRFTWNGDMMSLAVLKKCGHHTSSIPLSQCLAQAMMEMIACCLETPEYTDALECCLMNSFSSG